MIVDAGASSAAVAINVRIGGPLASSSRAEPGAAWLLYGPRSLTKVAPHVGTDGGQLVLFSFLGVAGCRGLSSSAKMGGGRFG